MGNSENIIWEVKGNVGILTIDNPPQNFLKKPDFLQPEKILDWTSAPEVNGLIIKGTGRHFSAGAEIDEVFRLAKDPDILFERLEEGKRLLNTIEELEIPVIAAIGGVCFGGGLEIALACHIRVCSNSSLFAFPEVGHNLLPGLGGTVRLSRITGESAALNILLTGDTIGSSEALKLKLVDHTVMQNEVFVYSMNMMERMVSGKIKKVVMNIMKAWHNGRKLTYEEALKAETRLFCELATDEMNRRKQSENNKK
jgi:enoyl-CoA hydratase/carnithine racemase